MGWLSIFKRKTGAPASQAPRADSGDAVQLARTRARQRLIGAAVLVVVGVIGFPLVFETQPRPIPVDIPIEIPRKDGAPPLPMPSARGPVPSRPTAAPAAREDIITETPADAGRELPPAASAADRSSARAVEKPVADRPAPEKAAEKAPEKVAEKAPEKVAEKPAPKPERAASKPADKAVTDAERARALLAGKDTAAAREAATPKDVTAAKDSGRYVVQVGAFTEADAAREMRQKVEKLGLKTYTQVAETPSGSRIRVRVGPFASREDADKALAKARAAGVSAVVLTL